MLGYIEVLIGLLATLITAYFGYKKYLDEKQFTYYRENVKYLFSKSKDEILAAIATLGVFKNRSQYKRSTVDVLLNLLYTELDYDISNAIVGVLAQTPDKAEIKYIAGKLIEINRNFFIQTYPVSGRKMDLEKRYTDARQEYLDLINENAEVNQVFIENAKLKLHDEWQRFSKYKNISDYELLWHKQVIADVLAMVLRKATELNVSDGISLEFFQNDFNYCQFSGFSIDNCILRNSAISRSTLTDISIKLKVIDDSTFANSDLSNCKISGGIIKNTSCVGIIMSDVYYENVVFDDVYFLGASIRNCRFKNIRGINPVHFFESKISTTQFDDPEFAEKIKSVTEEEVKRHVHNSNIPEFRKEEILQYFA